MTMKNLRNPEFCKFWEQDIQDISEKKRQWAASAIEEEI